MENEASDPAAMLAALPAHYGVTLTKTLHQKPKASILPDKVTLPECFVVVVTGASYGIAEHIAKAYAYAKANTIVLVARTESKLNGVAKELKAIAANQGRDINVLVHAADVTKLETSKDVAALLESKCGGRLDCLVCNAGAGESGTGIWAKQIHDVNVETLQSVTALNYMSAYYMAKFLIPLMLKPPSIGKTIINISSAASHMTVGGPHSYGFAKLALTRLTQDIGENYVDEGLTAIALHPGAVLTEGSKAGMLEVADMLNVCVDDPGLCGAMCVQLSLGRHAWLSGRYVSSNWDLDELEQMKEDIVKEDKLKFRMAV